MSGQSPPVTASLINFAAVSITTCCAVVTSRSELAAIHNCRVTFGFTTDRHTTLFSRHNGRAENFEINVAPNPCSSPEYSACSDKHSWRTSMAWLRNSVIRSITSTHVIAQALKTFYGDLLKNGNLSEAAHHSIGFSDYTDLVGLPQQRATKQAYFEAARDLTHNFTDDRSAT